MRLKQSNKHTGNDDTKYSGIVAGGEGGMKTVKLTELTTAYRYEQHVKEHRDRDHARDQVSAPTEALSISLNFTLYCRGNDRPIVGNGCPHCLPSLAVLVKTAVQQLQ